MTNGDRTTPSWGFERQLISIVFSERTYVKPVLSAPASGGFGLDIRAHPRSLLYHELYDRVSLNAVSNCCWLFIG
jgi:hypothetical protein